MTNTVPATILEQLGGGRFRAMTGAKNFVGSVDTLGFSIPKSNGINKVEITLDVNDTYRVTFHNINVRNLAKCRIVATYSDVYADQLQALFTNETGLYTRL